MSEPKEVIVPESFNEVRLDKAVKELFSLPWSKTRSAIEKGKISVDGKQVASLEQPVFANSSLSYSIDARPLPKRDAFDPSCIVFLDTHLVVANKPVNILTVPYEMDDKVTFDKQVRNYLTRTLPKKANRKGALASLMVVHRLDKLTSGLLVFPRTFEAKEVLAKQFRDHSAQREYLALVHRRAKSQTIKTHIMSDRGDGIRGSCETSPHPKVRNSQKGQVAITHVKVLEELKGATLVSCKLDTGRTNQIRIHMAEQGNPLIGERTYMRNYKGPKIDSLYLMLHAFTLGFLHPISGKHMEFTAPVPAHFKKMHNDLRQK